MSLLDAIDLDGAEAGVFAANICLWLSLFDVECLGGVHIEKLEQEALENAIGGGMVAIDLSLPDNRQLPAARSERVRARAHSEPFAELVVLVRYRAHDLLVCGGTHGRTSDESGMQAKSDQDGDEQGVRE